MQFEEITTEKVVNLINEFSNKKSTGYDNIPAIILKWSVYILAPIVKELYSRFVYKETYPNLFKIAKVTPSFKKGDKTDAENYRPISVLPLLNKVFEKIIHSRLVAFIDKHNILTNSQFGFRKGHSTYMVYLNLMSKLSNVWKKRKYVQYCL